MRHIHPAAVVFDSAAAAAAEAVETTTIAAAVEIVTLIAIDLTWHPIGRKKKQ